MGIRLKLDLLFWDLSARQPDTVALMRYGTVLLLEAAIIVVSGVSLLLLFNSNLPDRVFGAAAAMSLVLTVLAAIRRSWARVPLGVAGALSVSLMLAAFAPKEPSDIAGFAYLGINILIIAAAGLALLVSISEYEPQDS